MFACYISLVSFCLSDFDVAGCVFMPLLRHTCSVVQFGQTSNRDCSIDVWNCQFPIPNLRFKLWDVVLWGLDCCHAIMICWMCVDSVLLDFDV